MNRHNDPPTDPILRDLNALDRIMAGTEETARRAAEELGGSVSDLAEAVSQIHDILSDLADRVIELEKDVTTLMEERDELKARLERADRTG